MADIQHDVRIERQANAVSMAHDTPERTSCVLIEAIASLRGVEHTELAPLYETIDPEALDSLCSGSNNENSIQISFRYEGYDVTVDGTGRVRLDGARSTR